MPSGQAAIAGFFLLVFLGAASLAATYPPDARLVPLAFAVPGALLSLLQLGRELRAAEPASERTWRRRDLATVAWFAALIATIVGLGFTYGAPTVALLFLVLDRRQKPAHALAAATGLWLVLAGVERALGLDLFDGLLVGG